MERRIAHIARCITARVDLQSRFNHWNNIAFNGELPNIPVRLGRSKTWGGLCKGTINSVLGKGSVSSIEISDYIIDDQNIIDKILLHEMIHAYMFLHGKKGHGWEFDMLRRQLSQKTGVNITITEDVSNFRLPEDVEAKQKGVVVMQKNGKTGVAVYNLKYFVSSLDSIKNYYQKILEINSKRGDNVKYTFVVSSAKDLFRYPEKRSILNGFYQTSDSFVNEVLSGGKKIDEIAA